MNDHHIYTMLCDFGLVETVPTLAPLSRSQQAGLLIMPYNKPGMLNPIDVIYSTNQASERFFA